MAKNERPLAGRLLEQLGKRAGAKVTIEPNWKIVGQIAYKNGKRSYFRYSSLDINPLGASDVCKDKDYAAFFMRKMGYPVPKGKPFLREDFAQAIGAKNTTQAAAKYARTLGFPLIVKPNSGSQGRQVFVAHDQRELLRSLKHVFSIDRIALVQKYLSGGDYRIVVLDGKVVCAYERIPLSVVGDGRSSIRQLLEKKLRQVAASSKDTRLSPDDARIRAKLQHQKLTMNSVPKKDRRIFLLDNANLSSGGSARDVTNSIHPAFKKIAVKMTKDMGLRLCGIDLMVQGDIANPQKKYWVLEVNASPGLDHYAALGGKQKAIVETMYLNILKAFEKN